MMKSNTLFLFGLLASTLIHAALASGIHYLYFSSAQIQIKSGDVSREIDITFEFAELQPASVDFNKTKQVYNIDGNNTKQNPIIQTKANTKIETAPVSEDVQEYVVNRNDLEVRTVSGQMGAQPPLNPPEVEQRAVSPRNKKEEQREQASLADNGIRAYTRPEYIKNPPPKYPRQARIRSLTGKVTLKVEVKTDGSCGYIEVVKSSGYSMLDKAATKAVKEWQFVPAKKWGSAVSSFTEIVVNFQLK
jgi:TonB family protein